ncbi:GH20818 [Drosophila grimshawi]|uniref:GH20818 n=2 Tax=Drosophila grimshawi TaxID=7222 RepID=B4J5V9_DROGR|nr:GH20818 [Drosophila grimshawi]
MLDAFIDWKTRCLKDPCSFDVPRADLIHYKPTDKLRRKYRRTWCKFVLKRQAIKMKCMHKPVTFKRRKPRRFTVVKSSCQRKEVDPCAPKLNLRTCKPMKKTLCPRLTMPHCKPSVVPPSCKRGGRKRSKCRKRLTKYPAFSECLIDPLPSAPRVECNCLLTPSMCSVWEYYRNKKS